MQWAHYFRNIVTCYQVAVEGWPTTIPFANLSSASSSLSQLGCCGRVANDYSIRKSEQCIKFPVSTRIVAAEMGDGSHLLEGVD